MTGKTARLTMAEAVGRYLCGQFTEIDGGRVALFAGVFGIFGRANVPCPAEALERVQGQLPTWRGRNEQSMALAAIVYAKARKRRQIMVATSSVGPGERNMITAAGVGHANRLPVLLLAGDTFINRLPDPVLQPVEHFGSPGTTVNDCFRTVSRHWGRSAHPAQIIQSLPQAVATMPDPADCGPAFITLPQDIREIAWTIPRPRPPRDQVDAAIGDWKAPDEHMKTGHRLPIPMEESGATLRPPWRPGPRRPPLRQAVRERYRGRKGPDRRAACPFQRRRRALRRPWRGRAFGSGERATPPAQKPEPTGAEMTGTGRAELFRVMNAIGLTDRGNLLNTTPALFDRMFAMNVRAPFFLMQDAVKVMEREGIEGRIVNIGSTSSRAGQPFIAPYCASKAAPSTLTRSAGYALMRNHVHVNQPDVGWMSSDHERQLQLEESGDLDWEARARAGLPFGRLLDPEEVARAVPWMASDDSGMLTGSVVHYDQSVWGGYDGQAPGPAAKLIG